MAVYRCGRHHSRERAEKVVEICGRAFRQAGVLCDVENTTADSRRLEGELKMRERIWGKHFDNGDEIEEYVADSACVSIQVQLSRDKDTVSDLIKQNFIVSWPPDTVGDASKSSEYTNVNMEYYWVSLEDEKEVWPPRIVEIQVATDPGDRLFRNQHELGVLLCKWAAINDREEECGDIQPLWELLGVLGSRQVAELKSALAGLDISTAPGSEYSRKADGFAGVEFSLAMYVTDSIMRSPRGIEAIQHNINTLRGSPKAEQQRQKVEVIRNSFIGLAYLYSWGEEANKMLFDGMDHAAQARQRMRIAWLDKRCTKGFLRGATPTLREEEADDLEKLWLLFERHGRLPAQYVFSLARLGVKGHTLPCWPDFRRAIFDLVYNEPNRSGLRC
ncbi:uncharacterized protein BDV17DRAFT_295985 [Aspergillus undulatus]|uniref:uncharacterized protein n=1 Tax=Aspergillus undulatus TaxID=1810928 RepID=UPI003CCCF12F